MSTAPSVSVFSATPNVAEASDLELHLPTLKVISYRGPGDTSGVPTSLEPVVRRLQTKVHWFAIDGQPSSGELNSPNFMFYTPLPARPLLEDYKAFCSEYLWPLFHGHVERANFDIQKWKSYKQLSEMVASEALSVCAESFPTLCWLHDYQMALVPPLMAMHAGIILCHFWHVVWPEPSVIAASPIGAELVESLLANRAIGFHTAEYATNFLETVRELIPNVHVDMLRMEVRRGKFITKVLAMPLGIDVQMWENLARRSKVRADALASRHRPSGKLILGVDRLDYTKGILEKLKGIELFLEKSPRWRKRFNYVQITYPQSDDFAQKAGYAEEVRKQIQQINAQYSSEDWQPITLIEGLQERSELSAWYQAADILAVNPIKDGLNLIAKEFVACRLDESGVVILSRQSGCASELGKGALIVDAANSNEFAKAMNTSLAMESDEKRKRMLAMRRMVGWNQLQDWAVGFLKTALSAKAR